MNFGGELKQTAMEYPFVLYLAWIKESCGRKRAPEVAPKMSL